MTKSEIREWRMKSHELDLERDAARIARVTGRPVTTLRQRNASGRTSSREIHAWVGTAFVQHHRPPDHNPDCRVCLDYPGWWKREV